MTSQASKLPPHEDLGDMPPSEGAMRVFSLRRSLPAPYAWIAAVLLTAIAVLGQVAAQHQNEALFMPYALPVLLLAVRFGEREGVASAGVMFVIFAVLQEHGGATDAFTKSWIGYALGGISLALTGWVLGRWSRLLVSNEERFRTSVETLLEPFGIYRAVRGPDGEIVDFVIDFLNPAGAEANGLPREEQVGRRLLELFPGRLESGLFGDYCRVVETGEPLFKEAVSLQELFGEQVVVRAFDLRVTKLGDGFAAAWRDITARKAAERKLKASEERLQAVVGNLPLTLFVQDTDLRYVWIAEAKLGYRKEDVIGKTDSDFLPPDQCARVTAIKRRVLETGESTVYEVPLMHGGREYWWETNVSQFLDENGDLAGVVCSTLDVTDRKHAEREREWTAAALDAAGIGLGSLSRDWMVMSWSRGAEQALGYTREEAVGRPITFIATTPEPGDLARAIEAAQAGTSMGPVVVSDIVTKEGKPIAVEAKFFPILDGDGEQIGIACTARFPEL